MAYFKVIQDNTVVSVGSVFLKWNTKKHRLFICDVDNGQFVQSFDEKHIYKDDWLKTSDGDIQYENASIVIINETEYEDLKEMLIEGEPIIEEPVHEPVVVQERHEPEEEEKPLTIAQMREIIAEQQKQIELLMKKVQ